MGEATDGRISEGMFKRGAMENDRMAGVGILRVRKPARMAGRSIFVCIFPPLKLLRCMVVQLVGIISLCSREGFSAANEVYISLYQELHTVIRRGRQWKTE